MRIEQHLEFFAEALNRAEIVRLHASVFDGAQRAAAGRATEFVGVVHNDAVRLTAKQAVRAGIERDGFGIRSEFGLSNYASSKAGLIGLTRSAAVELGPSNVNVNAVAPGYIRTTRLTDGVPAEIMDRAREKSVLGRLGDPQDVASVILFLCSEVARHISGAVIPVDGGYLL